MALFWVTCSGGTFIYGRVRKSFVRVPFPLMRSQSFWHNHFSKTPPPNITLGLRFSPDEFGEDTDIQSISF